MTTVKSHLVKADEHASITVVVDGEMYIANSSHPAFNAIVQAAINDDPNVVDLFDVRKAVQRSFERVSDRITLSNDNQLYFDGELMDNTMAELALSLINDGAQDFTPFIRFIENVMQNPNEHSRTQLFDWLRAHNFDVESGGNRLTINAEGNIVSYKGVIPVDDGSFKSISAGTAVSDGVEYTGQIPQKIGSVVEMPRGTVQHNPGVGCSVGLHVGTWSYASGFARGAILTVEVNPRDVVSVPTDCGAQKLRTCRYKVLDVTEVQLERSYYGGFDDIGYDYNDAFDEDYDWDDYDPEEEYEDDEPEEQQAPVSRDYNTYFGSYSRWW